MRHSRNGRAFFLYLFMEIIAIITLASALIATLIISHFERKDLYDRLMSSGVIEYKSLKETPNQLSVAPDETLSLEDAREEIENDFTKHG